VPTVLDRLSGADNPGIENVLVGHFTRDVVRLFDQAVDRRALHPFGLLAELLEHLIEARDLVLGLLQTSRGWWPSR
jgi:hypothetical protein